MAAQRFPLTWPSGWKRTPSGQRQRASFAKSESRTVTEKTWENGQYKDVNVKRRRSMELSSADASDRLERQLELLGATNGMLSTNQELRMDGRPKSNVRDPLDVGAAVYFRLNGHDRVLACDRWDRVADNIAALAAHIDAMRRIDRYGVGDMNQAFAGYVGLPAKGETWRATLGFSPDQSVTKDEINAAFRERARTAHPDVNGGSHDAMASLTQARDEAQREVMA